MREFILLENGTKAYLSKPYQPKPNLFFVERNEQMKVLLACLTKAAGSHQKKYPLLIGPPGVGKTELCFEVCRIRNRPLWVFQGHAEVYPSEIVYGTRLIPPNSEINAFGENFLSSITSSMAEGGWCLIDELGKIPAQSLSLLYSICDTRDYLEATGLGSKILETPGFRLMFTAQSNEMANLPEEFKSRLIKINVPFPTPDEIELVLKKYYQLYGYDKNIESLIEHFWLLWHRKKISESLSIRDIIKLFSFAQDLTYIDKYKPSSYDSVLSFPLDDVPFCGITKENLEMAFEIIFNDID
jgi:MoxR-like ATPase